MRWLLGPLLAATAMPMLGMAPAQGATVSLRGTTANFRLELDIGPPEHMYSPEDAARLKPANGEIMFSGHMVAMTGSGMAMTGGKQAQPLAATSSWRHLELHVWSKSNGAVVKDANVAINVDDLGTGKSKTLPISVMYGIRAGTSDWHYGNNVMMGPGHWVVKATVNGEPASFTLIMPPN